MIEPATPPPLRASHRMTTDTELLARIAAALERLAPPVRIGRVLSLAGLIEVSPAALASIRAAHRIGKATQDKGEQPRSAAA